MSKLKWIKKLSLLYILLNISKFRAKFYCNNVREYFELLTVDRMIGDSWNNIVDFNLIKI